MNYCSLSSAEAHRQQDKPIQYIFALNLHNRAWQPRASQRASMCAHAILDATCIYFGIWPLPSGNNWWAPKGSRSRGQRRGRKGRNGERSQSRSWNASRCGIACWFWKKKKPYAWLKVVIIGLLFEGFSQVFVGEAHTGNWGNNAPGGTSAF